MGLLQTRLVSEDSAALPQFPHGHLHLVIPQGVDEGVQHRGQDSVDHTDVLVGGEGRKGLEVDEDAGYEKDGDDHHVRGTGGERLPVLLSEADPDCDQDEHVRRDQHQEANQRYQAAVGSHEPLGDIDVRAGKPNDGRHVAEEVVDGVRAAERELDREQRLDDGVEEASCPADRHQDPADPPAHGGCVVQGLADGHVAVVGHHRQEEHLRCPGKVQKKQLGYTGFKGNGLSLGEQVHQHPGAGDRDAADVYE